MRRAIYEPRHEVFRDRVRAFLDEDVLPYYDDWRVAGQPTAEFWLAAGRAGILGIGVPERFGGLPESDFRHSAVVTEEIQAAGVAVGLRLQTDVCMPYFLELASEEQRARWLPELTSGRKVAALAISEPGAGSDVKAMSTTARRDGDVYVLNGTKTFISNGHTAGLVIVAAKTDPAAGRNGISLLVLDTSSDGFSRGRRLAKLGQKATDLSELFFDDVRVPAVNLLGEENAGFGYLMANLAQERLSIGLAAQATATAAIRLTRDHLVGHRDALGQRQKFELATCASEAQAGQALVDAALAAHVDGALLPDEAAGVKLFCTEMQGRVVERCLALHGLAGALDSAPIGRLHADSRVTRIYGGSSEIMKVIVAQSLGL